MRYFRLKPIIFFERDPIFEDNNYLRVDDTKKEIKLFLIDNGITINKFYEEVWVCDECGKFVSNIIMTLCEKCWLQEEKLHPKTFNTFDNYCKEKKTVKIEPLYYCGSEKGNVVQYPNTAIILDKINEIIEKMNKEKI